MGLIGYGSRAFQKRKELQQLFRSQSLLLTSSYLLLSFFPIFESAFGSISFNIIYNTSILNLYGVIVKALALLVFFFTLLATYNFLNLINSYLLPDFSIVLSLGGVDNYIKDYQSGSFLYFVFISNILALIFSHIIGLCFNFLLHILFPVIPFSILFYLPNIFITAAFIFNIFGSLIISGKIVSKNMETNVETLQEFRVDKNSQESKVSYFFLLSTFSRAKSKLTYKIASYNISRLSLDFIMNMLNFIFIAFLIFSSLIAVIVVNDSTVVTMQEAIGEHSYAITKNSMAPLIEHGYDLTDQQNINPNLVLNNSYFSKNTIESILTKLGITKDSLDERLILYQQLKIIFSLYDYYLYNMFVVGYDKDQLISNFRNHAYTNPNNIKPDGSLLATWNLVSNPLDCTFVLKNYPFYIFKFTSLIQDPFVKGNVVYVNINSLISSLKLKDSSIRNVIFLKNLNQSTITDLKSQLSSIGFSLIDMQKIIDKNANSIRFLGFSLLISEIPEALAFLFLFDSYAVHMIEKRKKLLNSLKGLGAKSKSINDIIWIEVKAILIWGSSIGLVLSVILVFGFLIPNFVISLNLLLIIGGFIAFVFILVHKQIIKSSLIFYNMYIEP